jgi:hypothetical protein
MQNFISDGYTELGYIAAVDGMHGKLRFTFRPLLPEEVDEVQAVLSQDNVARSHEIIRGVLVRQVKSWSDDLPVSADSLRTIRPSLWNRLYLIVSGQQPSDPDPEATAEERSGWVQDVLESGRTGQAVGQARAERDAKNSKTG